MHSHIRQAATFLIGCRAKREWQGIIEHVDAFNDWCRNQAVSYKKDRQSKKHGSEFGTSFTEAGKCNLCWGNFDNIVGHKARKGSSFCSKPSQHFPSLFVSSTDIRVSRRECRWQRRGGIRVDRVGGAFCVWHKVESIKAEHQKQSQKEEGEEEREVQMKERR